MGARMHACWWYWIHDCKSKNLRACQSIHCESRWLHQRWYKACVYFFNAPVCIVAPILQVFHFQVAKSDHVGLAWTAHPRFRCQFTMQCVAWKAFDDGELLNTFKSKEQSRLWKKVAWRPARALKLESAVWWLWWANDLAGFPSGTGTGTFRRAIAEDVRK